ncbi:MAG: ABC transporter ATP-binding protein [Planctomycetes bacterium]|nr:ABC transporter ATP-binding protein [Planctomycetota bacterium]
MTIRYGTHVAVSDVDAELPSGCVGLLGRNGAGKTSILKALLGLVRPSSGELTIAGVPRGAHGTELRRHVGYMPERDCLVPGLNGYETVRHAAELTGLPARIAARRAHEVLWYVELGEQRYRPVAGYSAGMRQKVKLAVALVHDPAILFLDEPTNGLDPDGRRDLLALIASLAREFGKTVVLSTHILPDVDRVCSDVVVLERGRVVAAGPLAELTRGIARRFRLTVDAQRAAVRNALLVEGASEVLELQDDALRVTLPEGVPVAVLFRAAAGAGVAVHALVEERRSLAEIFLGAVDSAATASDGLDAAAGGASA